MAHPGIITVDDRVIKYQQLIVIPIRPMRPREDGVTVLTEPTEKIYQVDVMDLNDRWHSFTCRATPPTDGGCPTEFVALPDRSLNNV